jgi:hypothetical protein
LRKAVLAVSVILLALVFSPISSGAAPAQHLYAWSNPWSSATSGYQYSGPTTVSGIPGTVVQISTSNAASYALTETGGGLGVGRRAVRGAGRRQRAGVHDDTGAGGVPGRCHYRLTAEPDAL